MGAVVRLRAGGLHRLVAAACVFVMVAAILVTPPNVPAARAQSWAIPGDFATIAEAIADGAVTNGDTIVVNSGTFSDNLVFDKDLIVLGEQGAVHIDVGGSGESAITVNAGRTVTLVGLSITGGGGSQGAGINNLGSLDLVLSELYNNSSDGVGGGIYSEGALNVDRSVIYSNGSDGPGGGLFIAAGTLDMISSGVVGNYIFGTAGGGGIEMVGGAATLTNTTIIYNSSYADGGGVSAGGDALDIRNTVIADNSVAHFAGYFDDDCTGVVTSSGHNFIGEVSGGCSFAPTAGDLAGTPEVPLDPRFGYAGSVGLPFDDLQILSDSPLIDAGDNTGLAGLYDVTGIYVRTIDGTADGTAIADIGAYEFHPITVCPGFGVCEQETLLDALDAASTGDVIRLAPGDYTNVALNLANDITIQGSGTANTLMSASSDTDPLTPRDTANRPITVNNGAAVALRDLTVMSGEPFGDVQGGGIFATAPDTHLELNRVRVTDNLSGDSGGGIAVTNGAGAYVSQSTIEGNVGEEGGGGIYSNTDVSVEDSTITNNSTILGSGGGWLHDGAATYADLSTSTVTGNFAVGPAATGGGIAVTAGSFYTNYATIWDNDAELAGDGVSSVPGSFSLFNSILAEPAADDVCEGEIDADGFSLVSDADDCTVNDLGGVFQPNILGSTGAEIDPLLGGLADNGGPTQTLALLGGSPAIDTADDAPFADEGTCGGFDQRGEPRPSGIACDMGAYEGSVDLFVIQDEVDAATPGDTINLPIGSFTENVIVGIDLNFVGAGIASTTVSGGGAGCVFEIQNGAAVTFTDMTITDGDCPTGGGINMTTAGATPLEVTRVAFVGNNASAAGGGAIAGVGDMTIINSTFLGNTAPAGTGGAVWTSDLIADLDISNSSFTNNSSLDSGGAIRAGNDNGSVTISGTSFSTNSTSGAGAGGGAIYLDGPPSNVSASFVGNQAPSGYGGAIWVRSAVLTMNLPSFTTNSASSGGAIHGTEGPVIDITGGTFSGNTATTSGGAINTVGTSAQVFLSDTDVELNSAPTGGGAIVMDAGNLTIDTASTFTDNDSGIGGAIRFSGDGDLTINSATFSLNSAAFGGAIFVGPTASATRTVDIDNATFEENHADEGGALNVDAATFTIDASSFDLNDATNGGAIYVPGGTTTLEIGTGTTLTGNEASGGWGGAIFGDAGTLIDVVDSTVGPANTAANLGGGIYSFADVSLTRSTVAGNSAFEGGGLYVHGSLTVAESTISGNDSSSDAGGISAINLDMRNSTVSGNTAAGDGGGIHLLAGGTVAINNSTIVDNEALVGGGGVYKATEIPAAGVLSNTIIANNTASDPTLGHDCSLGAGSGFIDGGFNLIGRGDVANPGENQPEACGIMDGGGNLIGFHDPGFEIDPLIGPLAVNGAVDTETHSLLPGSPAIDAGNTFGNPQCEPTSQNGLVRPQGGLCDIGAFEVDVAGLPSLVVDVSVLEPTVQPGLTSIPVDAIGTEALGDPAGLSASEVAANQEVGAIKESPIANIPIANIPIANIFIADAPINSIAASLLGDLLLIDIPVDVPGGWPSLVGPNLSGPIQQYTLADAFDDPATAANIDAAGLSFQDLGLASTPIGSLSPLALALGATPIANIPIDGLTDPVAILEAWCGQLAGSAANCGALGVNPANPASADDVTLFSLALAEAPIANIPIANIPIANIPIANIPIANIPIANIPIANIPIANLTIADTPIANIPIANIPIANLPIVLDCDTVDCTALHAAGTLIGDIATTAWSGSFGELLKLLIDAGELSGATLAELLPGLPPDTLIGDLIAFLLPPTDQPWQEVDLQAIRLTSAIGAGSNSVRYDASFTATNIGPADTVEVAMIMPPSVQYVAGSASFEVDESAIAVEPVVTGDVFTFTLVSPLLESNPVFLSFEATTPLKLGPLEVIGSVDVPGVVTGDDSLNQFVTEAFEPNNSPATATAIDPDTLYVTHIGSKGDRDFYRLSGVQAGSAISVILANLPADYDVVLYGPEAVTLRGTPEKVAAGVRDPDVQLLKSGEVQAELVNDILLENLDIVGVSANRGVADETIDTGAVARTGNYFIQVTGYNGAKSALPYSLRVRVEAPGGLGACVATPVLGGTPGTLPGAIPPGTNTLFLWNRQRFEAVHGTAATNLVAAAMERVAGSPSLGVNGAVIPVEGAPPVAIAYADWNADPCSVDKANAVANSVAQLVDNYRASNPSIQYVVLVGSDEQIPQFRIYDTTTIANENTYTSSIGAQLNEITAALAGSFYFSDDPYGDAHPVITRTGQEIYVPTVALGRLVEDDIDILRTLQNFLAFNGLLDPTSVASAFVTGYDFLSDGAAAVGAGLAASGHTVTPLINDSWDRNDLAAGLLNGSISLASPNAHYDHYRAQPANAGSLGLFENSDVDAAGPSVMRRVAIFTMGCHSGLSISDVQIGGGPLADDWPQTYAGQGAGSYIGNSGFGYGETETVALSESLMQYYAQNLSGIMTAGQAFQFAKHRYAAGELLYGSYDQKVLMEATYFGLPMFRIGGGGILPATPPVIPVVVDGQTGLVAGEVDLNLAPGDFELTTRPRGQFYSVNGNRQVTPFRPVQPKVEIDVTQPNGLMAQGAIITGLSSTDISPFDPVVARPTVDLAANEPEPRVTSIFPTQLQTINRYLDFSGFRDQLVVVPGQFRNVSNGLGVQRLFGNVELTVYYAPPGNTDVDPPVILRSQGFQTTGSNQVNFRAEIQDDSGPDGVVRVVVLFKNASQNAWTSIDLVPSATGVWSGSALTAGGLQDFFIQAVDSAGNVGVTQKKGEYFETAAQSTSSVVTISGAQTGGWYQSPVIVEIAGAPGTAFGYDVDGEGLSEYSAPFPVSGEGTHLVDILGSDGTDDALTLQIDDTPPVVLSPLQGAVIPQNAVRPVFYGCWDAASGVDQCNGPAVGALLDTTSVGTFSFEVNASDVVGNGSATVVEYTVAAPPSAAIEGAPTGAVAEGTVIDLTGVTDALNPNYGWRLFQDGNLISSAVGENVSFLVPDDASYEVRLKVFANGIDSDPAVAAFDAYNVDPLLSLGGDDFGEVGVPYGLELLEVDDPGDDSVFSFLIDWGDGDIYEVDALGAYGHSYVDPGPYEIYVEYEDEDGSYAEYLNVTVGAGGPTITADESVVVVDEGDQAINSGIYGGFDIVDVYASQGAVAFADGAWTWADDTSDGPEDSATITVTVEDGVGSLAEVAFDLVVDNVAPVADLSGDSTTTAGADYSVTVGPVADPGDDEVTSWAIDWGDGSAPDFFSSAPGVVHHVFSGAGDFEVVLSLEDEDGTYLAASLEVSVAPAAEPTILVNSPVVSVDEGDEATNSGTYTGTGDIAVSASVGEVVADGGGWQWSYVPGDGPDDSATVTVTITDDIGSADVDFALEVLNVAPMVQLSGQPTTEVGADYELTVGPPADPGDDTVTEYVIDWGDGTPLRSITGPAMVSHQFSELGVYTIRLDVTDEDGTYVGIASIAVAVVEAGLSCATAQPTITGTSGNDIIFGTNGPDVIFGFGGHDLIFGRGGDDLICSGSGNDIVHAGSGDDRVESGPDGDLVFGGAGADTLIGGDGGDLLDGGSGNDVLQGGLGDDLLWGRSGRDLVSYESAAAGIRINLTNGRGSGEGRDRLSSVEDAVGSKFGDTIIGSRWRNVLVGLDGADVIKARNGDDDVYGGGGDDTLYGNGGDDFLDGGADDDWVHGGSGFDECVNGETVHGCEIF